MFDATLAPLEQISGVSNPKGENQTLSIRICERLTFDAYSAFLELISGNPPPIIIQSSSNPRKSIETVSSIYRTSIEHLSNGEGTEE